MGEIIPLKVYIALPEFPSFSNRFAKMGERAKPPFCCVTVLKVTAATGVLLLGPFSFPS